MSTAPKAPALIELRQLSYDLHMLALSVVKTVGDGAGYADPDAARLSYKDALRLITRHAMRVALETYDFDSMVLLCRELSSKAARAAADKKTAADQKAATGKGR